MAEPKLTLKQQTALNWMHSDGSKTEWNGVDAGHPAISSLQSLVRLGLATKTGGDGWTPCYRLSDAGRAARKTAKGAP